MSPQTRLKEPSRIRQAARRTLATRVRRISRSLEKALNVPIQPPKLPPPIDMLIATVLSQNTNDKNSHRAYVALRQRFATWDAVAEAPARTLEAAIRSGGMANQKAARIKEILRTIYAMYGNYDLSSLRVKTNEEIIEELTCLKGVGTKTAACVLLFALGRDVFPVDTHVHRICGRLGLTQGSRSPDETFEQMKPLIPAGKGYSFHTNLIRFGRKICRSQRPACGECPLYDECHFDGKIQAAAEGKKSSQSDHTFMLLDNISP
jgi:endonuclease III